MVGNNHKSMMVNDAPNNAVFMSQVKAESKDHKWKEAPIMGMEEKRNVEEQRQFTIPEIRQNVKPTTEGKVIRIIDGKSEVGKDVKKTTEKSMAGSRKKVYG